MVNESGIVPLEYRVLVLLEQTESVTSGGIVIPEMVREKESMATTRARLVAVGGNCFEDWKDERLPKAGDSVLISKYAGQIFKGNDGREYRICNDKDIAALLQ